MMRDIAALLAPLAAAGRPALTERFAAEPERLARLSVDVGPLHFDFSKMPVGLDALPLFEQAIADAGLAGWRDRLLAGDVINPSEGRAATHMSERCEGAQSAMLAVATTIRADPAIRHVIHVGIGGSALGPALLVDALGPGDGPDVAVVSNIDGVALEAVMHRFDPAATLLVIASKTFTTVETMTNAASALDWMRAGGVADPLARCVAVTAAPERAAAYGIAPGRILPFAESVGGRYSLWSAVGLPFALAAGPQAFEELLAGAASMDAHFATAAPLGNAPVLAALLDIVCYSVNGWESRAVFAYDERLALLPSYLQQLEMESNGKSVTSDGAPVILPTAPVTWGGTGTDAQHAVFQLLHQGTRIVPVEFIASIAPGHSLGGTHHRQLLANCFAQGAALMRGRTFEEALALSGGDRALAAAKTFPGNRPSTTILLEQLGPSSLGALLAFYEHRTFVNAVLLGINPFDQWGVELGKELAKAVDGGAGQGDLDPSTRDLMRRAGL